MSIGFAPVKAGARLRPTARGATFGEFISKNSSQTLSSADSNRQELLRDIRCPRPTVSAEQLDAEVWKY